jgi:ABC-type Fe3+-hydroxamate transport system substrate-binding protein
MEYIDQTHHKIYLENRPRRIISIVPSQSELLWDLGLRKELAGITKFCIHPDEMFRSVTRVGGTKKLDLEKIRALKPDLIIGNKEENEKDQIEQLQKEFPVWMSDIYDLDDAFEMIISIGTMTGKNDEARKIITNIKHSFSSLDKLKFKGKTAAYFIWYDPWMAAAKNTFIDFMLSELGFENVFSEMDRYPETDLELIKQKAPDYILLSSEPYPFREKHAEELKQVSPDSKIILVDGEMFSWYGSRLQLAPGYFNSLAL